MVHHSNKSSSVRHECTLRGRHSKEIPVAQRGQHDQKPFAQRGPNDDPTVIAQSHSEDDEGISPHVLEEMSPQEVNVEVNRLQHPEGIVPRQPVKRNFQEQTETLNVLVNDGSKVGAYTLDLFAPPKSTSEILQLPTLESKRFLRDLHGGKIRQICVLVTEDEYVADIRSAVIFAENERVLSSSSMDESVLDEKTRIERYDTQSWESLKTIPLYKDLVEFMDVSPEAVLCELPKEKGILSCEARFGYGAT